MSVCGAVWHRLVQPFLSRCGSRVSKSVQPARRTPSMTLKALQTIIMACDGCLLAYLTLYLPLSLFAPLSTCLSLYFPHCLPVCASACLFVRLGNFTISFLSFLSKVLYRNLLYLPLLLTLLSHTHTRTHMTASEQQQRQRQNRDNKTALHIANI